MQNPNPKNDPRRSTAQPTVSSTSGILPRIRSRLFGEPDPVEEQLRDIARQGSGMAAIAHSAAFLLIILFSLGSLVALSGDALVKIAREGIAPATIPDIISAAISTLLVTCMDVAMLYAASMIRILLARRAAGVEMRWHIAVLIIAAVLEAATYCYMAFEFDRPATAAAWVLVGARAGAAPLFSVYLSMARALPVGPRDILYQVELATGRGVIRDTVEIANDTSAPLARKMQLYRASAVMAPQDRSRLEQMIETMKQTEPTIPESVAAAAPDTSHTSPVLDPPQRPEPPQGPHDGPHDGPQGISNIRSPLPPDRDSAGSDPILANTSTSHVRVLAPIPNRRTVRPVRADAGKTRQDQAALRQRRVEVARTILAHDPTVGVRDLTRKLAMATKHRISESTASEIRRDVLAEMESQIAREQQDEEQAAL